MISAVVISIDDNSYIEKCLQQLDFVNQIVIVGTLNDVEQRKFDNKPQITFIENIFDPPDILLELGRLQCKGDWVLGLQAYLFISEEFFILTYEPKSKINIQSINELEKFVNKISNLQWVSKTISIINAPLLQSSDEPLMDRIKNLKYITNPEIKFDVALNELVKSPVYKNLIISEDAKTLGIVVYLKDNQEYLKQISDKSMMLTVQNERQLNNEENNKLKKINTEIERLKKRQGDLISIYNQTIKDFSGSYLEI